MKGGYSMNCPHCQNPVDDNTVFCPVCGQSVQSAPTQNTYEQQQSYTAPDGSYQQNGANLGTFLREIISTRIRKRRISRSSFL